MQITDLMKKIEDEIMTYSHVRDVNTGWVADLIVSVQNMLEEPTPEPKTSTGVSTSV